MTREVPPTVVGIKEGGAPPDPLDHFHICRVCRQPVDRRDLGAVFHHEGAGHDRLPEEDAVRLLSIEDRVRLQLITGTAGKLMN